MNQFLNIFIAVVGYAARAFLRVFAVVFALLALYAFVCIFTDCFAIGLMGCAAAAFLSAVCWHTAPEIPVK